jgi:hypothetical protein
MDGSRRKSNVKIEVKPDARESQEITITNEIAATYSLDRWAADFWLMTAGYRAPLDPKDIANPEAPFNALTILVCAEAKARVFKRKLTNKEIGHVHIGGEVRPHTQDFIKLASRVYTAHGFVVHLRKQLKTTPICTRPSALPMRNSRAATISRPVIHNISRAAGNPWTAPASN